MSQEMTLKLPFAFAFWMYKVREKMTEPRKGIQLLTSVPSCRLSFPFNPLSILGLYDFQY